MKSETALYWKRPLWIVINLLLLLLLISCSTQSNQPNPATPEGRFELAKRELSAARFDKALDYTEKILRDTPNHELATSAFMMELVIHGGLAEGYRQIGKVFADGRNMSRDVRVKNDFRFKAFDYYKSEKARLLQFAERFDGFSKKMDRSKPIVFQGVYPAIEAGPRIFLEKVKKGMTISDEDQQKDAEGELRNGVLTMATALAGVGEDRAKAKAMYAAATVSVDPADFLFAVSKFFHEQDALFDTMQLNELQNMRTFCDRTSKTVTESLSLLKSKGDKKKIDAATQLQKDCDAMVKKVKK
jgi:hypothetical protein